MSSTALTQEPLKVTSLERMLWTGIHDDLQDVLTRIDQAQLLSPTMLIVHDLLDSVVRQMHRKIFFRMAEDDFGIGADAGSEQLESLYHAEETEHGSQNIARYCQQNGWHVLVSFPSEPDVIIQMQAPVACDLSASHSVKLVDALRYQLLQKPQADGSVIISLKHHAGDEGNIRTASLLDHDASIGSVQRIYDKLGYGVIVFSGMGEVLSLSRSMLASVKLPDDTDSVLTLCNAIPFNFYNDIIWGLALAGQSGTFENYRIRMRISAAENVSVLFNISGFRDEQGLIHSLWQVVSFAEGGAGLSEGSMLSEARVHKITRNYVPQLVEEKARAAVRMGKDSLINEECQIAVLFCDIVGFTSYVESNATSESIINTLNIILRRVSSSVKRFHGSIDKFMGDSVMAIFRDPANAIYAAMDMQSHSADINGLRSRAGQETLRLRIGIHWGEVVIGNVGTAERLDWTAIGDVVNTASRIEKNCQPGSILVSQATRDAIVQIHHPEIQFGELFEIKVKGKREALPVCHIKHQNDILSP